MRSQQNVPLFFNNVFLLRFIDLRFRDYYFYLKMLYIDSPRVFIGSMQFLCLCPFS